MSNITLNSFLNYSYDNYYSIDNICSQRNSTLFCMTEDEFKKINEFLLNKNYDLNKISLNIYLLQDISKKNEIKTEAESKGHS